MCALIKNWKKSPAKWTDPPKNLNEAALGRRRKGGAIIALSLSGVLTVSARSRDRRFDTRGSCRAAVKKGGSRPAGRQELPGRPVVSQGRRTRTNRLAALSLSSCHFSDSWTKNPACPGRRVSPGFGKAWVPCLFFSARASSLSWQRSLQLWRLLLLRCLRG